MTHDPYSHTRFATRLHVLAILLFVGLMITSIFDYTKIEYVFFPALGVVVITAIFRAIQKERQKKVNWIEANRRHREEMDQQIHRATWPPRCPADAGGSHHVEVDVERLREALFKSGASRTVNKTSGNEGKHVSHMGKSSTNSERPEAPKPRTPDQYSRRTDKPVETSASTDPLPITSPAHPLHAQTYGSTFGNTNSNSYPSKAPCAPAPSSHSSSYSSYDSSPSYSCSSDSGSSISSDSGSCGGGGGCD